MTMASRIAVLDQGVLLQTGTPSEIFTRPTSRFVAEFMGPVNWLDARVVEDSGKGTARLETPLGVFNARGAPDGPWKAGGSVLAGFRPSAASLSPVAGANMIACEVLHSQYAGAFQHLLAKSPSVAGLKFQITENNPRRVRGVGERLEISVLPEDMILVPL